MDSWRKKVREDWRVFRVVYGGNAILNLLYQPSFKIVFAFRMSQLFFRYTITKPFAYLITVLNDTFHGVWIGPAVKVGKGFFLGHPRGLIVHPDTAIGDYVSIVHQVTLGGPRLTIGDYVAINAGAKVINDPFKNRTLTVGRNSVIAAGAIVLNDIPENSLVVGMPGKVTKTIPEGENWLSKKKIKKSFS